MQIYILLLAIFQIIKSLNLIPDPQNAVSYSRDLIDKSLIMTFKFSFQDKSQGLKIGQYLVLEFPKNFEKVSKLNNNNFDCSLTNGKIYFSVESDYDANDESNKAYCKFYDEVNPILNTGLGNNYTLKIRIKNSINQLDYQTLFLKYIKIFTTTSKNKWKIILDSLFLGSTALYDSKKSLSSDNSYKPFEITATKKRENKVIDQIYINESLDVELQIISKNYISSRDIVISFRYDKKAMIPFSSVSFTNFIDKSNNFKKLTGNLNIMNLKNQDSIAISGITEEFTPNQIYRLNLNSWKILDIIAKCPFEIIIYYKNTYSILSYTILSDFFNIQPAKILMGINHPDGYDIFKNGVYPMRFWFKSNSNVKDAFIQIQQTNTKYKFSRFNFVASTCDFSENENIDNNFGKRPQCYPLVTDFEYDNFSEVLEFFGSGIFFKFPKIEANKVYNLTVWGSADSCGNTNITTNSYFFKNSSENIQIKFSPNELYRNNIKFAFQTKFFSKILQNNINQKVFDDGLMIGKSDYADMDNICWNSLIQLENSDLVNSLTPFEESVYQANILKSSNQLLQDKMLYREFSDWSVFKQEPNYNGSSFLYNFLSKSSEVFLYSNNSTNKISNTDYLTVKVFIPAQNKKVFEFFPTPIYYINIEPNKYLDIPGRLAVFFQKKWFSLPDFTNMINKNSYFAWDIDSNGTTEDKDNNDDLCSVKQNNFIFYQNRSNCKNSLDYQNSNIFSMDPSNNYKILSIHNPSISNGLYTYNSIKFPNINQILKNLSENSSSTISLKFAFNSNCFKWNTPSMIKSLYTNIDIQIKWLYSETNDIGFPSKIIRLIKLFPEGGVFQDNTSDSNKITPTSNQNTEKTYKIHNSFFSNYSKNGICIIEINGDKLNNFWNSESNILVIWLGFGVILEQDYNDLTANYPVGPLADENIYAIGLKSGYFFNAKENQYFLQEHFDKNLEYYLYYPQQTSMKIALHKSQFQNMLQSYSYSGYLTPPYLIQTPPAYYSDYLKLFERKSSYLFLFGSIILLNNINNIKKIAPISNNITDNLLIPIYCPIDQNSTNNKNNIIYTNGLPTLYITYLKMESFSNIISLNKIFTHNLVMDSNPKIGYNFSIISPVVNEIDYVKTFNKAIFTNDDNYHYNYLVTLRWNSYIGKESPSNILHLLFENKHKTNLISTISNFCTGNIFLIGSSDFKLDTNILFSDNFNSKNSAKFIGKKFYYLGFEFNKAFFFIRRNSERFKSSDQLTITGIYRPSIDKFFDNSSYQNQLAYFCIDDFSVKPLSGSTFDLDLQTYSNFELNANQYFLLDFDRLTTSVNQSSKSKLNLSKDNSEDIYKNDPAGNVLLEITTPSEIAKGMVIGLNIFGSNYEKTVCGIENINGIVSECEEKLKNTLINFECPLDRNDLKFRICCYNIIQSNFISQNFNMTIYQPNIPELLQKEIISDYEIIQNDSYRELTKPGEISFDKPLKFIKIIYEQINHDGGIGKVNFILNLPRNPLRNAKYILNGDFRSFVIQNVKTFCKASFLENSDISLDNLKINTLLNKENNPDILIDSCDIENISSSDSGKITILTKNILYKCGMNFITKSLRVSLFPIIVTDFLKSENSNKLYKFEVTTNTNIPKSLVSDSPMINLNSGYNSLNLESVNFVDNSKTLCQIDSISPPIAGVPADYYFMINLQNFELSNKLTEITIFFPLDKFSFDDFGIENDFKSWNQINNFYDIMCRYLSDKSNNYDSSILLPCYFNSGEGNFLNIILPKDIKYSEVKNFFIKISGILNPSLEEDIEVICTLNTLNISGKRVNIKRGSGIFKTNSQIMNQIPAGVIRFFNIDEYSKPNNIGEVDKILKFRIGIDYASDISSLTSIFLNNPLLIIFFPSEYRLCRRNDLSFTIQIFSYFNQNGIIAEKINSSYSISGNRLEISLQTDVIMINLDFMYFEINLTNFPDPIINSSKNLNFPYSTTKSFEIVISNQDYSIFYKSFSNLNNFSSSILSNQFDDYITNNKGLIYIQPDSLLYFDIECQNEINKINLKSGKYTECNFKIKNKIDNISTTVTISLIDKIFEFAGNPYNVNISDENTTFYIGAPCGSYVGNYIVKFKLEEKNDSKIKYFSDFSPLIINLEDPLEKVKIFYEKISLVTPGYSNFIQFYLIDPNVDQISINFSVIEETTTANYVNYEKMRINNTTIPKFEIAKGLKFSDLNKKYSTEIRIDSSYIYSIKQNITFSPKIDSDSCYEFSDKINIPISLIAFPSLQKNYTFENDIKFLNSDYDNNLKNKNAIILYIKNLLPLFVFCSIVPDKMDYPLDILIKNPPLISVSNQNNIYYNSAYVNYDLNSSKGYYSFTNLTFDNLLARIKYKIRCLISTTEIEEKMRNNYFIEFSDKYFTNYKNIYNTTNNLGDSSNLEKINGGILFYKNISTNCYNLWTKNPLYGNLATILDIIQGNLTSLNSTDFNSPTSNNSIGWNNSGCPVFSIVSDLVNENKFPKDYDLKSYSYLSSNIDFTIDVKKIFCFVPHPKCFYDWNYKFLKIIEEKYLFNFFSSNEIKYEVIDSIITTENNIITSKIDKSIANIMNKLNITDKSLSINSSQVVNILKNSSDTEKFAEIINTVILKKNYNITELSNIYKSLDNAIKDITDQIKGNKSLANLPMVKLISSHFNIYKKMEKKKFEQNSNTLKNGTLRILLNSETDSFILDPMIIESLKEKVNLVSDSVISNDIEKNNKNNFEIKDENFMIQYFADFISMNNSKSASLKEKISFVNFNNCTNKIKDFYKLKAEISLKKIDWNPTLQNQSYIADVYLSVYDTNSSLPLDFTEVCKDLGYEIRVPISNNEVQINQTEYNQYAKNNFNIYDATNQFYTSRCTALKNESSQGDITMNERINKIYKNYSISCGQNCIISEIDKNNYTVCNCYGTNNIKALVKRLAISSFPLYNIEVVKCYRNLNWNIWDDNLGFKFFLILTVMSAILIIIFQCYFTKKILLKEDKIDLIEFFDSENLTYEFEKNKDNSKHHAIRESSENIQKNRETSRGIIIREDTLDNKGNTSINVEKIKLSLVRPEIYINTSLMNNSQINIDDINKINQSENEIKILPSMISRSQNNGEPNNNNTINRNVNNTYIQIVEFDRNTNIPNLDEIDLNKYDRNTNIPIINEMDLYVDDRNPNVPIQDEIDLKKKIKIKKRSGIRYKIKKNPHKKKINKQSKPKKDENGKINIIDQGKISFYSILDYENMSINCFNEYDKRSFFKIFGHAIIMKHIFFVSFFYCSIFDPYHIRLTLFSFYISLSFLINTLLFSDDLIAIRNQEIKENAFNNSFYYSLYYFSTKSIWSMLIMIIPCSLMRFLVKIKKNCRENINIAIKTKQIIEIEKQIKYVEKEMRIRYIIFYFIYIIVLLFSFYLCSVFCSVYVSSSIFLINSSVISLIIDFLLKFIYLMVYTISRILVIKFPKSKCLKCIYFVINFLDYFT